MTITGTWQNQYGSIMTLTQEADGYVYGQYSSSTGSSGTYYVEGYAAANPPATGSGVALALSIFWRSISGGQSDPSWHWVSGLGGQAATLGPVGLNLIHALVATDNFPDLAGPGTYPDKLTYIPVAPVTTLAPLPWRIPGASERRTSLQDPVDGPWQCQQDPSVSLSLSVINTQYGAVSGTLSTAFGNFNVNGFADTYAAGDGLQLEGLTLSALLGNAGPTWSLSGSLNFATKAMTMTRLINQGTPNSSAYVQSAIDTLTFTPS